MRAFKESDSARLRTPVEADVIGERRKVPLPAGTSVAVVLVHGAPESPDAYELEAYIAEQNCYALATVPADGIE